MATFLSIEKVSLRQLNLSIYADRQGVCMHTTFQPFHEGFRFCIAAKFDAPRIHPGNPTFARGCFFDSDQHH